MGWLEDAIEKYTAKNSDGTPMYDWGPWKAEYGKNSVNGTMDTDVNGSLDIDCSHLVNEILRNAGYNINYENTNAMKNSNYYNPVTNANDIQPGDVVLFDGHVGIVTSYNPITGEGTFFGSQSSTGPAITKFGPGSYWNNPVKFLRPKYLIPDDAPDEPRDGFNDATKTKSPIVLDLDGNGIKTFGTDAGIHFDHDGNGFKELSGWIAEGDGLLMIDRNANNVLDSGNELFGNYTPLSDGKLAINGFQALAQFDVNGDGKIDADDPIWSQLRIWQHDPEATDLGDPDSSGIIKTLSELGIQSIGTGYTDTNITDANGTELFGNQTILSNGTKATNGFQALAELDDNKDGKIDSNDAAYSQLKIWQGCKWRANSYRQKTISNNNVERVMFRGSFFS